MRIVFMGTPDFAVETLRCLYEANHTILAVVSQPDKPTGRGKKIAETPTKAFAMEKGIPVYQPEKIRNNETFLQTLKDLAPEVIVVVAYGKILPTTILEIPKYGCINVHASLLPKYRGAAPIQWAIIRGETETGVTTMMLDAGMDTGDMLLQETVPILPEDTYGTMYETLKQVGGQLAVKTLAKLEAGTLPRTKQPAEFSTAPMLFKEDGKIDWNQSAQDICNLVRGINPAPVAWTNQQETIYKIWSCREVIREANEEESRVEPGTILVADAKEGLHIATGTNPVAILEIQAPNGKRMRVEDYLRGNHLPVGDKMGEDFK